MGFVNVALEVRRFEAAIDIVPRIVEDKIHRSIPECTSGRIEIILRDRLGRFLRGLSILCIELQDIVAQLILCGLDLFQHILMTEDVEIVCHGLISEWKGGRAFGRNSSQTQIDPA